MSVHSGDLSFKPDSMNQEKIGCAFIKRLVVPPSVLILYALARIIILSFACHIASLLRGHPHVPFFI
ncbi:hypothetical protein NL676_020574 [Syzygium grande]|nr:hypothetical protein NL676_020574 [Syzygium grande]